MVEWGALEKRCARKGTEGSNPSFSAFAMLKHSCGVTQSAKAVQKQASLC